MKLSRKWILVAALVMSVAMATSGTLAYLTDRDSETNVFTFGNVDIKLDEAFEQGTTLVPGVEIQKVPTIKNIGKNDAWVWMTFSIPSALDNWTGGVSTEEGSYKNVIHWNPLGATTEGYVTEDRVAKAVADGILPEGTTVADVEAKGTWDVFNEIVDGNNAYQEKINGIYYNTYVIPFTKPLKAGDETWPGAVTKVYLDAQIDIDPKGDLYKVVNGEATPVDWNINDDGAPTIYVAAYAIQVEGFESSFEDAYEAYGLQWGKNGGVEYDNPVLVTSIEELRAALEDGATDVIVKGVEINESPFNGRYYKDRNIVFADCTFTANMNWMYINNATFTNCTFDVGSANSAVHYDELFGDAFFDGCTFKSGKVQIGTNKDGTATVTFNDCEFAETTQTHSIWSEMGIRIYSPVTFNGCEFNNRVVMAGFADQPVTFENCTMNGGTPVYYVDNTDGIIRGGNIPAVTIK